MKRWCSHDVTQQRKRGLQERTIKGILSMALSSVELGMTGHRSGQTVEEADKEDPPSESQTKQ